jgi:serine/threonine protein kinase
LSSQEFFERYNIDYTNSLDVKGHGAIYSSYDNFNNSRVAIKIIEILKISDNGELAKKYESSLTCNHPNILKIIDFHFLEGEDTIKYFLVFPLIIGENLQNSVGKIPLQTRKNLLKPIIEGLKYLHDNGFIWQNLRADHIIISKNDDSLIPLFINCYNKDILKKAYFYNYEYLSPEQLDNHELDVDNRTDIWSLGVLLFHLFTEVLPFGKKTVQYNNKKIQDRILNYDISDLSDQIPEPYHTIVNKCLKIDKSQRWASVGEIIDFLHNNENITTHKKREVGVLSTLEKLGESSEANEKEKISFFERKIKRLPRKPISIWEPLLWLLFSILVGYIISKL